MANSDPYRKRLSVSLNDADNDALLALRAHIEARRKQPVGLAEVVRLGLKVLADLEGVKYFDQV